MSDQGKNNFKAVFLINKDELTNLKEDTVRIIVFDDGEIKSNVNGVSQHWENSIDHGWPSSVVKNKAFKRLVS